MSSEDETVSIDSTKPDTGHADSLIGTIIADRYRVLGPIGEGGFGLVYEAEQYSPVKRRVALKILKPGMDSKSILARFEAERQALALMDHSCIAKVLDAGQTERDLPYFVMELVSGTPITDYCDKHRLTIEQRLSLFASVCEAIQHAHTKAIIHRDIKPSNILVEARSGGEPAVKVIDFGIAKAMAQKLTEKTLFTERGQMIGTPEYMSPEQAEMTGEDIDIRSDVYSLGVLLYELLSGERPFDLRQAALMEIQRVIRQVDPPRPSTRLTNLDDSGSHVAECRRTDPKSLSGRLRRELEWIPLRALRKDRTERYRTAADLADDVLRYIAGEALEAGPETSAYRLRKMIRRYKGPFVAVLAVMTALLLGIVGTGYGIVSANKAVERADAEAVTARMAESEAQQRFLDLNIAINENTELRRIARDARIMTSSPQPESSIAPPTKYMSSLEQLDTEGTPLGNVDLLVIHHSGIPLVSTDLNAASQQIDLIRESHTNRSGWHDIGYHILIDPAGRVWMGRPLLFQGAHLRSHNPHSIGICVMGDYVNDPVPPAVEKSLRELIPNLCAMFSIGSEGLRTHRELEPAIDPGDELQALIQSIRYEMEHQ